ncbi:D-alanyl-D-alanine carboxypeptidase/D-alanyl-D-alanine endopeptidase [Porphyromonas gingivicanis]|uniref:D-alanyl-D-alanine carboxypeptidase/D-alanyl-D-alanine endopeptidase n=1 Tax=Porphyromonas gingivicanis TaxID=266762 RepID=UPI000568406A|nr:D-alanyl-D-alanine carboxypeptidase/D-alanyl-D-alanine-endopeptidase [Porphyromonas gingivicanis]
MRYKIPRSYYPISFLGSFLGLLLSTFALQAQQLYELSTQASSLLRKSEEAQEALYSVAVQDIFDPSERYGYASERVLCPASVTKLFTTAIALDVLGPDYSFVTDLYLRGKVEQNILNGDLIVVTHGDPSIASKYFPNDSTRWIESVYLTLQAQHIKEVRGNIIIESASFDSIGVHPLWDQEDRGEYYATGVYAANIYDNWIDLYYTTGRKSDDFTFLGTNPPDTGVEWRHQLSVNCNKSGWGCRGYGRDEKRTIKGTLPCNRDRVTLKSDLPNPPRYMGAILKKRLIEYGIFVEGQVQTLFTPLNDRGKLAGKYYSPSLKELCREMNYRSLNHYAEAILKTIAIAPSDSTPASTKGAIEKALQVWKEGGLTFSPQFRLYDGSGLARANRTSASDVTTLLNYVALGSIEQVDAFMQTLPQAGVEGTVKNFMKESYLRLFVKSGSMKGIQCYAGYLHYNGRTYSVALLASEVKDRVKVRLALQNYLETLFPTTLSL